MVVGLPLSGRLRALAAVVALAAVGVVALLLFERWLADLRTLPPDRAATSLLLAWVFATVTAAALTIGLGAYLIRYGGRVRAAAQFPPAGVPLRSDAAAVRGEAARKRGRVLQLAGAALVLCAGVLLVLAWRLYAGFSSLAA